MPTVSGYGRIANVPAEDLELTRVGHGTPMGELLRRYWQPVCLSADIDELPKITRILGEELVAFRDRRGRVGVLDAHCCHRGTSLEYGRVEDEGIRCCYHGWLFAADGRCLEQPGEPPHSNFKNKVAQPAYPAREFGGLVFAYMGPPDKEPLFPRFDILERKGWELFAYRNMSRGAVAACNWLQIQENAMDPVAHSVSPLDDQWPAVHRHLRHLAAARLRGDRVRDEIRSHRKVAERTNLRPRAGGLHAEHALHR